MNEILSSTPTFFTKKFIPQVYHVRKVEIIYRKLMLMLEYFNCIFGYPILFIMANTVAVMLESLRNALQHHNFVNIKSILIVGWSAISTVFVLVFFLL